MPSPSLGDQEYSHGTWAPAKAVPHPKAPEKEARTSATLSGELALPPSSLVGGYWP